VSGPRPMCPRCGYDLEGLIATWTESCPMHALCSECGLDFVCSRALSPRLIGPRWSYEHGFAREFGRWWATSGIALLPRRMFRDLAVDHRINAGRLVRLGVIWLLIVHIATGAVGLTMEVASGSFGAGLGQPIAAVLLLPEFWWYALPRLLFPYGTELMLPAGPVTSMSVPLAPVYMLIYIPTFLMPAWMLILSSSMRTARVRRIHLLRGVALSLVCAAAYAALIIISLMLGPLVESYTGVSVPDQIVPAALLACFGHHLYWWFMFIRRYLRLKHAAAVVTAFTVMNVLVLMITFTFLSILDVRF
jgi:hypothetical protein